MKKTNILSAELIKINEVLSAHLLQHFFLPTTKKMAKAVLMENKARLDNRIIFIQNEIKYAKTEDKILFFKYLDMLKDQQEKLELLIKPALKQTYKATAKRMAKKMQSGLS